MSQRILVTWVSTFSASAIVSATYGLKITGAEDSKDAKNTVLSLLFSIIFFLFRFV